MFKHLDKNGDGKVDEQELKQAVEQHEAMDRERARLISRTHTERLEVVNLILEHAPITSQRASTPLPREYPSSGRSSSTTPPPLAVEFTFQTTRPERTAAERSTGRSSSPR